MKDYYLRESFKRNVKLTDRISVILTVLMVLLGLVYFIVSLQRDTTLYITIWLLAPIFLTPYVLNKFGLNKLSRFILSTLLPILALVISVLNKAGHNDVVFINSVNYFDVRLVIINSAIIPFILYDLKEVKSLILAALPSFIALATFDPVHNYFNVGFYQLGLQSDDYFFSANLYSGITYFFIAFVLTNLKYQVYKSESKTIEENQKVKMYLEALIKLGNSESINLGIVDKAKQELLKVGKKCFGVSRISLWNYHSDEGCITCEYLFENEVMTSPETKLRAQDFPKYFVALKKQQLIIAQDAVNDDMTNEFAQSYLEPLNIKSMMDAPFLNLGKLGGVICCEQQDSFKDWGAAESLFLKALGDFLSYSISVEARMEQNKLLTAKNAEITTINDNLERIVADRTKELEIKNVQLTEYAYINSHILRAPVARISGLYNLFKMQTQQNSELLGHMSNSIHELEEVTYKINRAIEEHGEVSRDNIRL
ncbi:GAF domain-containing protein [Fulvivirga lutimaris]|uniref:GAF domain-containing protein n=1 Tax=Fulvivirga lutimaris TaxID=1819566 RepID=UPI0012BD5E96|nr:GAF domain-containing protein [Fulvivirga lutimaris]MTI38903.1 GAF domain-containing protein [Fulvivirga lutimaris]